MSARILTYCFILLPLIGTSQFFNKVNWEENRHQIELGLGTSNFLGDLGGKDAVGTNDFQDLEMSEFRFGFLIGHKYTLYKKLYLRSNFTFSRVSGNDNLTEEAFRRNRNLHFRSNIFELNAMIEYEIPINFRKGHIYDIKGVKGWNAKGASFYVFLGIGGFYFNPKAQIDGRWVELRPLRTEGQGLPGGPKEYSRISLSIPVGASLSKRITDILSMGIEVSYRYTFTDYIDDVSTVYYSPYDIALYDETGQGDAAAYLSNPSLGPQQGGVGSYATAPGQQRGDETDDDGFMLLTIKAQYLLKDKGPKRKGARRKKFRRSSNRSKRVIF